VSTDPAGPATTALSRGPARQLHIFLTGYSFHDNTPPLSAIVSHPILHKAAGGQGTFRDPITVAVPGGPMTMKWKPGTGRRGHPPGHVDRRPGRYPFRDR
jgi:hypothetical protein